MSEQPHQRTECHACGARIHTLGFRCDGCERAMRDRIRADIERAECRTCGQQVLGERDAGGTFRCFHCLESSRAPQGVQDRLFEPARPQMEGQGFWAIDVEPLPRRVAR